MAVSLLNTAPKRDSYKHLIITDFSCPTNSSVKNGIPKEMYTVNPLFKWQVYIKNDLSIHLLVDRGLGVCGYMVQDPEVWWFKSRRTFHNETHPIESQGTIDREFDITSSVQTCSIWKKYMAPTTQPLKFILNQKCNWRFKVSSIGVSKVLKWWQPSCNHLWWIEA